MVPTHIHCLHEQSNQILDFEDTLGVVHFVQGFGYHTDGGLTHGVPEFVNLKSSSQKFICRFKRGERKGNQTYVNG